MVDKTRRRLLQSGVAATAVAAANRVLAQTGQGAAGSFYEKGPVRIHYQTWGTGFPLLIIPGGGLNSNMNGLTNPFATVDEFKNEFRCISMDLRNANTGQS